MTNETPTAKNYCRRAHAATDSFDFKEGSVTDQEVLRKAIEIAIKNGWGHGFIDKDGTLRYTPDGLEWGTSVIADNETDLLFKHDFARALWGEKEVVVYSDTYEDNDTTLPNWQYNLQQMVIAENPLEYLKINLTKEQ